MLRRDPDPEGAGRDHRFCPSADQDRLPERDRRAGCRCSHRLRAYLGHRNRQGGYHGAGGRGVQGYP